MALCGALGPDLSPVTPRPFTWQAWHKLTSTFVLRGRRGTYGIGWRAWSGFVARDAAAVCVADVVLGDIHLHFTWQEWHKLTSTVVLRGRRGTYGIPSFCVAGVALMALGGALGPDLSPVTPRLFAWQAWYLVTSTFISRGRRGTNSHPPSFCVAGVALMAYLRFAWQAWHLWHWVARLVRICRPWRRGCLRGRRGTWWHPPSFHVAGVAQTHIHRRFAWQAWHLWHTFVLRGRRGTYGIGWRAWSGFVARDAAAVCVAGVVLGDIHLHFSWQAWHKLTSTVVLRGRRGTYGIPSFCVAGVALMALGGALGRDLSPVTPRLFAWQAWYLVTSTFISRGRRGTNSHPPSFCVAGVVLGDIHLHFSWQAWHKLTPTVVLRGRRGTYGIPSFCVAGVALMALGGALGPDLSPVTPRLFAWQAWLGDIHLHFTWQAWHKLTSTVVLRGRRGTYGIPSFCVAGVALMALGGALGPDFVARDAAAVCVAGVVLGDIHLHFTWQVWHKLTSTVVLRGRRGTYGIPSFCVAGVARHLWHWVARLVRICRPWRRGCLRGRRGTWWHPPSFLVAGVAQTHIHRRFAWQACHTHTYIYIHTYIRTYVRTCIHTHIHTYTHTYIHTVLPSRSFTTFFVFPSFPVPAKTIEAHYWKKLTCGVIQSFNLFFLVFDVTTRPR